MKKKMPVLRICMFGRTIITYGKKPLPFGTKGITKVQRLLLIMCYSGSEGISRNKLVEDLFGREEISDIANSLRVTVHRLEKRLEEVGFPKHDYITVENGIYYLSFPMELEVDALIFKDLIAQAEKTSDREKKSRLLLQACELYRGEFLEDLSDSEWVLLESAHFKKLYEESLIWLCEYLKEKGKYEEIFRLATLACKIYPFDEWQKIKIQCYIDQNQYREAYQEYKAVEKMLLEELGIAPSQRMLNQIESIREYLRVTPDLIENIKDELKEKEAGEGAYYCTLPSFRDEYRFACRIMERNPIELYLMLCTITNARGYYQEDEKILEVHSKRLYDAIKHSLRRCDTFTRLNSSQFLILMVGTDGESCGGIFDRIVSYFSKGDGEFYSYLKYDAFSIKETEGENPKSMRRGQKISPK